MQKYVYSNYSLVLLYYIIQLRLGSLVAYISLTTGGKVNQSINQLPINSK